jgi:hypothetical protein
MAPSPIMESVVVPIVDDLNALIKDSGNAAIVGKLALLYTNSPKEDTSVLMFTFKDGQEVPTTTFARCDVIDLLAKAKPNSAVTMETPLAMFLTYVASRVLQCTRSTLEEDIIEQVTDLQEVASALGEVMKGPHVAPANVAVGTNTVGNSSSSLAGQVAQSQQQQPQQSQEVQVMKGPQVAATHVAVETNTMGNSSSSLAGQVAQSQQQQPQLQQSSSSSLAFQIAQPPQSPPHQQPQPITSQPEIFQFKIPVSDPSIPNIPSLQQTIRNNTGDDLKRALYNYLNKMNKATSVDHLMWFSMQYSENSPIFDNKRLWETTDQNKYLQVFIHAARLAWNKVNLEKVTGYIDVIKFLNNMHGEYTGISMQALAHIYSFLHAIIMAAIKKGGNDAKDIVIAAEQEFDKCLQNILGKFAVQPTMAGKVNLQRALYALLLCDGLSETTKNEIMTKGKILDPSFETIWDTLGSTEVAKQLSSP